MWRDYVRSGFVKALQRYVPALADADILPGGCGVRAQAVAIDGTQAKALREAADGASPLRRDGTPRSGQVTGIIDIDS